MGDKRLQEEPSSATVFVFENLSGIILILFPLEESLGGLRD